MCGIAASKDNLYDGKITFHSRSDNISLFQFHIVYDFIISICIHITLINFCIYAVQIDLCMYVTHVGTRYRYTLHIYIEFAKN